MLHATNSHEHCLFLGREAHSRSVCFDIHDQGQRRPSPAPCGTCSAVVFGHSHLCRDAVYRVLRGRPLPLHGRRSHRDDAGSSGRVQLTSLLAPGWLGEKDASPDSMFFFFFFCNLQNRYHIEDSCGAGGRWVRGRKGSK